MSRYTWLLDPGHGGIIDGVYQTAGKRSPQFPDGSVLYEGEFNRNIVKKIVNLCDVHGIDYANLVDTEKDLSLRHRVKKANLLHRENRNSIYISVHSNAFGNGLEFNQVKGVSTFYYCKSRSGKKLAETLQKHLVNLTHFRDRRAICNDTWANFYVLRKTHMPSILSENGFMTNLQDATALKDEDTRAAIAGAHFALIREIEENGL